MKAAKITLFACLFGSLQLSAQDSSLSEYERFVTYPFVEKSYRLETAKNYAGAISEIDKALEKVPGHMPFLELRFRLLMKAGLIEKAIEQYQQLPSASLKGIQNIFGSMAAEASIDDLVSFQAMLPELQGESLNAALDTLSDRYIGLGAEQKALELLLSQSQLSEKLQVRKAILAANLGKPQVLLATYPQLSKSSLTNAMNRNYGLALLKVGKDQKAFNFATALKQKNTAIELVNEYLQRQIAVSNHVGAKQAIGWLASNTELNAQQKAQYAQLAIATDDTVAAVKAIEQSDMSCIEKAHAFIQLNADERAKQYLNACPSSTPKKVWLTLASRLFNVKELKQQSAQRPSWSEDIKKITMSKLIATAQYRQLIELLPKQPRDPAQLEILALSLEKTGDLEGAARQFLSLYRLNGASENLDKATYVYISAGRKDKAKAILENEITAGKKLSRDMLQRLISLTDVEELKAKPELLQSLASTSGAPQGTAELLRVVGRCDLALKQLEQMQSITASAFKTKALCLLASDDLKSVASNLEQALRLEPSDETRLMLAEIYLQQGRADKSARLLNQVTESSKTGSWHLMKAQIAYANNDYERAQQSWKAGEVNTVAWYDFGADIAVQRQQWLQAKALSDEVSQRVDELSSAQWARLGLIHNQLNQQSAALNAFKMARELAPADQDNQLNYAYALLPVNKKEALEVFQQAAQLEGELPSSVWEQMAYLSLDFDQAHLARDYIVNAADTREESSSGDEKSWMLKRQYNDLSNKWKFSATATTGSGAVLGDIFYQQSNGDISQSLPTNSLTVRAEYFFDSLNTGTTAYVQLSGFGNSSSPVSDWSKELGITHKPINDVNMKVSAGVQRFFSGEQKWLPFVRVNGDALNKDKWRSDWRFESSWWERQLYYDVMYYVDDRQVLGQAIFDIGYAQPLSSRHRQTIKYYGVARYDYRKVANPVREKKQFDEGAIGLGVVWRWYRTGHNVRDRIGRLSVGLEARYNVFGDLTQDDTGVYLSLSYEY